MSLMATRVIPSIRGVTAPEFLYSHFVAGGRTTPSPSGSGTPVSAGHAALVPVQLSGRSHGIVGGRHTTVSGRNASAGQVPLVPLHISATSQAPAAGRQTDPAGWTTSGGQ